MKKIVLHLVVTLLATVPLAAATTPGSHLILPYFEVDAADLNGITTLWAVRNTSTFGLGLLVEYYDQNGVLATSETFVVEFGNTKTRNLRHVQGIPAEGYATFRAFDDLGSVGVWPEAIHGDYFWVEPGNDFASGGPLLRDHLADNAAGVPAPAQNDLCSRWDSRFFHGGAFSGGTDFVFYVTWDSSTPPPQPLIAGQIFEEIGGLSIGQFTITTTENAFTVNTSAIAVELPILPSAGSVEWAFAPGVIGHVVALHRASGRYSVSVPSACVD